MIRDSWKLIALVAVLAVGVSVAITARMTPRYASSVTFYVSASTHTTDPALAYQGLLLSQQAVRSQETPGDPGWVSPGVSCYPPARPVFFRGTIAATVSATAA